MSVSKRPERHLLPQSKRHCSTFQPESQLFHIRVMLSYTYCIYVYVSYCEPCVIAPNCRLTVAQADQTPRLFKYTANMPLYKRLLVVHSRTTLFSPSVLLVSPPAHPPIQKRSVFNPPCLLFNPELPICS
jgi:hypothetical protein